MSSSNKIHPIYVALDANQFNRAIKLCLAFPKENYLAQALLAHAYNKSMQRFKAILVVQEILGTEGFQELQLECKYAKEAWEQQQAAATASSNPQSQPAAPKKGKKGKKKPATTVATSSPSARNSSDVVAQDQWSLARYLESPPRLGKDWDKLPDPEKAITDETTLGTLVITLQSLKLFLTSYQLYCWAASKIGIDLFLRKAYLHGLGVLVAPQYDSISKDILANMQVLALQLTRVNQQTASSKLATSWVAQTALWQLKLISASPAEEASDDAEIKKEQQRLALLPRLAENLASKCIGEPTEVELASARREVYFLYLRTLEYQSKWREMLTLLQSDVFKASDETGVSLAPKQQVLEKQAECMQKLEMSKEGRGIFESLLNDYPDNFIYWKGHMECSISEHNNELSAFTSTEAFADEITKKSIEKCPQRGPRLILVELAARRVQILWEKNKKVAESDIDNLVTTIMRYGDFFSPKVSCAFTDLECYLGAALEHCNEEQLTKLLQWLRDMRVFPDSDDTTQRRNQQRSYIFSVKMAHKILARRKDLRIDKWLPNWKDLVRTWKKTHTADEQIQKESLPGDDLIVLAVQQILFDDPQSNEFFIAAILIEAGIANSPSNATLKIAALDIYSRLNAASRAWAIYQELQIKHIQLDTCTFLILPVLLSGGFYQEILKVSKGLLMLHTSVVREACEFMGRAMDNGILGKADEFMFFQREKMIHSLTALEATGLILDSAPFFAHDMKDSRLGVAHGIVGGESDFDRATDMVVEVRNPYGALSLLERTLKAPNFDKISDNRDLSILSFEMLYRRDVATGDEIIHNSLLRGHNHNLLIRSALCVHFTKGPKKGKIVKPSEELLNCCQVLTDGLKKAGEFCSTLTLPVHASLMEAQLTLCQVLIVVNSGKGLPEGAEDSLETREKQTVVHIREAISFVKRSIEVSKFLEGRTDVGFVCQLLPASVVPLFAIFRMCAETLESYGWGRRKLKTKEVAAEFARMASEFSLFLKAMLAAFSSPKLPSEIDAFEDLTEEISEAIVARTKTRIAVGQHETQNRVRPHLEYIASYLDAFESAGNN